MKGNNLNAEDYMNEKESLLNESKQTLQEFTQESKELQDKIQYFEYKNKEGEYYVFSYNAISGEHVDDIKQKYIDQYKYKGEKEQIIITDDKGNEILDKEFNKPTKINLKINKNNNRCPIKFYDVSFSTGGKYTCFIESEGWTPHKIRQIYQDQYDKIIPEEDFILLDMDNKPYNEGFKFQPGDIIKVQFNTSAPINKTSTIENPPEEKVEKIPPKKNVIGHNSVQKPTNATEKPKENKDKQIIQKQNDTITHGNKNNSEISAIGHNSVQKPTNATEKLKESKYKEMIENQTGPITHGNRNNPEISITFDDGSGADNIRHILDTLRGSGIHATFFILGGCLKENPQLWKQAVKEGHQICCHTYSHIYLDDKSEMTNFKTSLNKGIDINKWQNNVKTLLGDEYYNKVKSQIKIEKDSAGKESILIPSPLLLETEILMWEAQIKEVLGESYLQELKLNYPFFRFPGGHGWKRENNINVLKKLGYLSIGWSDDFFDNNRKHFTPEKMRNMNIQNGEIPLFHFKKKYPNSPYTERDYIDAYIENLKSKNKTSHTLNDTITP